MAAALDASHMAAATPALLAHCAQLVHSYALLRAELLKLRAEVPSMPGDGAASGGVSALSSATFAGLTEPLPLGEADGVPEPPPLELPAVLRPDAKTISEVLGTPRDARPWAAPVLDVRCVLRQAELMDETKLRRTRVGDRRSSRQKPPPPLSTTLASNDDTDAELRRRTKTDDLGDVSLEL